MRLLVCGLLLTGTALSGHAVAQDRIAPNAAMSVPKSRFARPENARQEQPPAARTAAPVFEPPGFQRPTPPSAIQQTAFETPAAEQPAIDALQSNARTPISRGDAPQTTRDGRPSAAATLRKGVWTSGTAVLLLALFGGALVWKLRGRNPALVGGLPAEAVEVLGRRRVDGRNSVGLVRVGTRVLVVGIGDDGMRTLCEVDEPAEVDRLAGLCRPNDGDSRFANVLRQALPKTAAQTPPGKPPTHTVPVQPAPATHRPAAATPGPSRPRTRGSSEMADLPGRRPRLDVTTP